MTRHLTKHLKEGEIGSGSVFESVSDHGRKSFTWQEEWTHVANKESRRQHGAGTHLRRSPFSGVTLIPLFLCLDHSVYRMEPFHPPAAQVFSTGGVYVDVTSQIYP